jgi:hypothetical protein
MFSFFFLCSVAGTTVSDCLVYPANAVITLIDALFEDCTPGVNASDCASNASIEACVFLNCSSTSDGGGIYFQGSRLTVLRSSFFDAQGRTGSAIYAQNCGSVGAFRWIFDGLLVSGSDSNFAAIWVADSGVIRIEIDRTNMSDNTAEWSSTIGTYGARSVVFQSCLFERNVGTSAMYLSIWEYGEERWLNCLGFRGNVCHRGNVSPMGMFCVEDSWTIENSVFENNSVVWIAGGVASSPVPRLVFEACVFDVQIESVDGTVEVSFRDQEVAVRNLPPWGVCPYATRSPYSVRTPYGSAPPTKETSASISRNVIYALIGGCVALAIGIACCVLFCGRCRSECPWKRETDTGTPGDTGALAIDEAALGASFAREGTLYP